MILLIKERGCSQAEKGTGELSIKGWMSSPIAHEPRARLPCAAAIVWVRSGDLRKEKLNSGNDRENKQ